MTAEEVLLGCARTCKHFGTACDHHVGEALTLARSEGRREGLEDAARFIEGPWGLVSPGYNEVAKELAAALRTYAKEELRPSLAMRGVVTGGLTDPSPKRPREE